MEEVHRWLLLSAPLAAVLALCVPVYGALETLTLLALSVLTLCGARLLQQRWQTVDAGESQALSAGSTRCWQLGGGCAALLLLLTTLDLLDDDGSYGTLTLILTNWPLLPMAFVMAGALEWLGTPSAVIRSTLRRHQTLFSDGAAWVYYLGYWAKVEEHGKVMDERMRNYAVKQDFKQDQLERTNRDTTVVLIPTTYRAMLDDADFHRNDSNVRKEEKLDAAYEDNGRKFGESHVYILTKDGVEYRTAMELATPMRHAKCMVEDNEISFTTDDFEEFARCFQRVLEQILRDRPALKNQLTLVPISDSSKIAEQVMEKLKGLVSQPPLPSPSWQSGGAQSLPGAPMREWSHHGPRSTHL